ncbi:MAG TPA: hypothetical protein VGM18_08670 [Candidatus Sulfotelmatobacter sp.]|jgi:hypothetical protein
MTGLTLVARIPRLRALAWSAGHLYASRGYHMVRIRIEDISTTELWRPVAAYRPPLRRRLSVMSVLMARLFRDGFHALAVLPSGALVAAVPGAIVTLHAGDTEFHSTHTIVRGTRPLHITAVPSGAIYWGEYFDNPSREAVHVYASTDDGATWSVAYTFSEGAIRHVHNIVHDPWGDCLWVFTGDYGDECRILRATCNFSHVEPVLQGQQQARAVAAVPTEDGLYFASDTPLEHNYIYYLDRQGSLSQLAPISSSSIYGCRVGNRLFFSTMVEPSAVNHDRHVRLYGGRTGGGDAADWHLLLAWKKDVWPMDLFQYGNALMPDGANPSSFLALTTVAVRSDDMVTSLYAVNP